MRRNQKLKVVSLLAAAGALTAAAAGIGLLGGTEHVDAHAASAAMVKTKQTGLDGKQYEIEVYRDENGMYWLADHIRNIVLLDGTGIQDWSNYYGDYKMYNSRNGVFNDPTAVTLFYNCVQVYDAYTEENIGVDRKGINGKNDNILNNADANGEVTVYAMAHINDDQYTYNAAFAPQWDSAHKNITYGFMLVGDGNPANVDTQNNYYHFYQQARAIDTIGHEYQHGITRSIWSYSYSTRSDFGAINEAVSDIFGMLIENVEENKGAKENIPLRDESWDNGTKATYDGTYLYSMRTRDSGSYYKFSLQERIVCDHGSNHTVECDYGYVHYNSTILTNTQYQIWKRMPEYFTRQRIGKLWYETIQHIQPTSTLEDFGVELLRAANTIGLSEEAQNTMKEVLIEKGYDVCRVSFKNPDGSVIKNDYVRKGGTATPPSNPTLESTEQYDYVFKGWNGVYRNVTSDTEVSAEYNQQIRKYDIQFYTGDKLWKTEQKPYGETFALPALPESCERGWYIDEALTQEAESETVVKSNLKLYAKLREFGVNFYTGGSLWKTEQQSYGDLILPELPEGYEGWYLDEAFTQSAVGTQITKDLSLYAKLYEYNVSFYTGGTLWKTEQQKYGNLTLPELPEGYEGWYLDETLTKSAAGAKLTKDTKVYAKIQRFEIGFYVDGTLWKSERQNWGDLALPELPEDCEGWYLDENLTQSAVGAKITSDMNVYTAKKSNLGLILGITIPAAAVLISGAAILFIILKKKRS